MFRVKGFSRVLVIFLVSLGIVSLSMLQRVHADRVTIADTPADGLNLDVKGAIAVDAHTGQVIFSKNANQKLPIASMSKLISIYLVRQAIAEHKLSWGQRVNMDRESYAVSTNPSLSNVPLYLGKSYTVRQLYQATLLVSANDAITLLGNAVAGNQVNFVNQMRGLLSKWGIDGSQIYTASGSPNDDVGIAKYPNVAKGSENALTTAGMAIVAYHLLHDYPDILKTTSMLTSKFDTGKGIVTLQNEDRMLRGKPNSYTELPVDGLKTGTTDKAGADFAGTVSKGGHRIITVVTGAHHKYLYDPDRFVQTQRIMSYVYDNFSYLSFKHGVKVKGVSNVRVFHGRSKQASLVVGNQGISGVWIQRGSEVMSELHIDKNVAGLKAPVYRHHLVGYYTISDSKHQMQYLSGAKALRLRAVTKEDIRTTNLLKNVHFDVTEFIHHKVKPLVLGNGVM